METETQQEAPPRARVINWRLFSSLQYSPALEQDEENTRICGKPSRLYMLPYHRDRMAQAAKNFGWEKAAAKLNDLDYLESRLEDAVEVLMFTPKELGPDGSAIRLRLLISIYGDVTAESNFIPFVPTSHLFPKTLDPEATLKEEPGYKIWNVVIDTKPTEATDFTRYKTTERDHYDEARSRVGIKDFTEPKEVALWSPEGLIMEGSITNLSFYREDRGGWITPRTPIEDDLGAGGTAGTVRRWLLEKGLVKAGDVRVDELVDNEYVWLSNGVKGLVLGRIQKAVE